MVGHVLIIAPIALANSMFSDNANGTRARSSSGTYAKESSPLSHAASCVRDSLALRVEEWLRLNEAYD